MIHRVVLIAAVLLACVTLALAGAVVVSRMAVSGSAATGPVYTVARVQDGLARYPTAWVGRTVLVRGTTIGWVAASSATGPLSALPCFAVCLTPPGSFPAQHLVLMQGTVSTGRPWPDLMDMFQSYRSSILLLHVSAHVSRPAPNSLLTFLRGLPIVGPLFPDQQQGPLLYHVRLLPTRPAVARSRCPLVMQACDDGVLLDVQSSGP